MTSNEKDESSIVGRAGVFAVVSGVVWSIMSIALWQLTTLTLSGSPNDHGGYEQRLENYKKQMQATDEQLRRAAELQTRSNHLLDMQERQLERFDAILDKWEKLPAR